VIDVDDIGGTRDSGSRQMIVVLDSEKNEGTIMGLGLEAMHR
jgi:hypothetical protein